MSENAELKPYENSESKAMNKADEMKSFESVHAYLEAKGLLEGSPASIVQAKKEYRKLYQKQYWEKYTKKKLNTVVASKVYEKLKSLADAQNCSIGDYVRLLIKNATESKQNSFDRYFLVELEAHILSCLDDLDEVLELKHNPKYPTEKCLKKLEELLIKIRSHIS